MIEKTNVEGIGEEYLSLANLVCSHIQTNLSLRTSSSPLFVGLQGPQGSGKTTVTGQVQTQLKSESLSVAVISIDDFYLPHADLVDTAERKHPGNGLLKGRGQPGTHDVELAERVLQELKTINDRPGGRVELPSFDKSLHNGEGDRVTGPTTRGPVDVVLLEGWCLGFYPLDDTELETRYHELSESAVSSNDAPPDLKTIFETYSIDDIKVVNGYLKDFETRIYPYFDAFVQITPQPPNPYSNVYTWRLEQEHWMKSQNGGRGMSDAGVKTFIDRYIPGYLFFSDGIEHGHNEGSDPPWKGRLLRVTIDAERKVTKVEHV